MVGLFGLLGRWIAGSRKPTKMKVVGSNNDAKRGQRSLVPNMAVSFFISVVCGVWCGVGVCVVCDQTIYMLSSTSLNMSSNVIIYMLLCSDFCFVNDT